METPQKKKRFEAWPMAIVFALATFIGSIVYAVVIMSQTNVPLVAENYYEEELKYQEQIDIETRTLKSGKTPQLVASKNPKGLKLVFAPHSEIEMDAGRISFERPADPKLDFEIPINPDAGGTQFVDLSRKTPGLYLLRISWQENGLAYYHETNYAI